MSSFLMAFKNQSYRIETNISPSINALNTGDWKTITCLTAFSFHNRDTIYPVSIRNFLNHKKWLTQIKNLHSFPIFANYVTHEKNIMIKKVCGAYVTVLSITHIKGIASKLS